MKPARILIVDFDPLSESGEALKSQLSALTDPPAIIYREVFHSWDTPKSAKSLSEVIVEFKPDLVVLVLSQQAQLAAPSIFGVLLGQKPSAPIVAVPCSDEPHVIRELFELGASDYLIPPFRRSDVQPRIQRLLSYRRTESTPASILKETLGLQEFVGKSSTLLEQIQKIPRMARCDAGVLITGETGTGKELCARAVHYLGSRADHPFVPLNCGAIPVDLLENELFGHAAGAFTGANAAQAGLIQEADGGTLFLDEIDSLPAAAQVKLLRFLQEKVYRALGASKVYKADVRIIAASNTNLEQLKNGKLRQDLFYRLNVLPLHLPPLRERKEDIPLLSRHFLAKYVLELNAPLRDFAPGALHKLSLYDWPGNVRELENVIERAVVLCGTDPIESDNIDLPVRVTPESEVGSFSQLKAKLIAEFERSYLMKLLEVYQGNIAQAARAAHKHRRVFFQLMRKHHIRVERPSSSANGIPVAKFVIIVDKNVHPPIDL